MTMKCNCVADHDATLTDEHAGASYGMPLVVGADGATYGPLEAGAVNVRTLAEDDAEEIALVEAARAAGYRVYA
jgi:hypothetical protein